MTRVFACLLSALLAAAIPSHATPGSENVPKVLAYTSAIGTLPPATRDSLAWYDVLVCFDRPEHIAALREKNPSQRYLWALLPQYVEPVTEEEPWWMPDTLWSIKRLLMLYAHRNDWYLYDVNGGIVTDGAFYLINWTEHCPVGTFGNSKGLRASEWLASVALPEIALSGRYWDPWNWDSRTAYNGYMFEILADCLGSYYWQNYQYADPDRDGDADGVYATCSTGGEDHPLSVLFRAENEVFYDRLNQAFPPEFVFTIQGNWDFIGPWWLTRLSGIKLENWMRRESNPEWVDWWDHFYGLTPPWEGGVNHGGGYAWAERMMDKPVEDRLRGWDLSFIQVHKRDDAPESENERQMRWGLGTSMLGDGYFCYSIDQRLPLWPEEFSWDFGTAAGEYARETIGSDTLYVRLYTKGMVEVNPHDHAVGGVGASDSRFTFWASVSDLAATAQGADHIEVRWTSPDGGRDDPESFDLRYSEAAITLENWDQAASYAGNPIHADAGRPIAVAIDGLAANRTYHLGVRGRYHGKLEAALSNPATATTTLDLAPPEAPARVWREGTDAEGQLVVAWEPSASPDVDGYHVYGRDAGQSWERLTTDPLPPTVTTWSAPPGRASYGVSALDAAGNESAPREAGDEGGRGLEVRGPFPHPVGSSCRIEILAPPEAIGERLRVRIYDSNGEPVRTLIDETAPSSVVPLFWDRREDGGALAAPGFYLLRAELGGREAHRRIYLDP